MVIAHIEAIRAKLLDTYEVFSIGIQHARTTLKSGVKFIPRVGGFCSLQIDLRMRQTNLTLASLVIENNWYLNALSYVSCIILYEYLFQVLTSDAQIDVE